MSIEALWVGRIQDVSNNWHNGGVVVFETGRVYGGDSSYYYIGNYKLSGGKLTCDVRIVHYAGDRATIWGDNSPDFRVRLKGGLTNDNQITGQLTRPDAPGVALGFVAVKKEELP